jgi:hypothetical protein
MATRKGSRAKFTSGRISLKGPRGERVDLHLGAIKGNAAQKAAVKKLFKTKDIGVLSPAELNSISRIKYQIPSLPGDAAALIVRFDWKWVRIDEPSRVGTKINPGPFKFSGR